jgi:adenosine deaminase
VTAARRVIALLAFACVAFADERSAAKRLEEIRHDPPMLRQFLERMPKGGDLHNHLSGAVYAETFIELAATDGLCIDTTRLAYAQCSNDITTPASKALSDPDLYQRMLDAMSMRQFRAINESGHDHFFATFGRFSAVARRHPSEMLTEVVARFARENVDYVESLFPQDLGAARELGKQFAPGTSFADMRGALLKNGAPQVVSASRTNIDNAETYLRNALQCGTPGARKGCDSTIRYLFETHRAFPREQLFAELLVGFELANVDSRVVGVNVVQAEDSRESMTQFDELMKMFAYLRSLYPKVRVAAHAGELASGLVPPEGMQNHIRDSVTIASAERIGHGVDIAYERDAPDLLRTMAKRQVAVEVCLTSNDVILGVSGRQHPIRMYMNAGVPVVLATDDPGVSRSDMTNEWMRAVEEHGVTYADLKRFARNSLEFSFLEGASLWADPTYARRACTTDCTSAKQRAQLRLEERLRAFENGAPQ